MRKFIGEIIKAGALALGLLFLATPAMADATWAVGDRGTVGAYCQFDREEDIERFIGAVEVGGIEAYKDLMNSPLPCYDARMHRIPPAGIELVEYYRDATYTNGNGGQSTVEIWKVRDSAGNIGYSWLPKKDSLPEPGQPT